MIRPVSDPVLIRGDGQYLYTLASVVDDLEMGISHVVRGSDHVTNTATQIQMMQALSDKLPNFAHHSLLTGPNGEALSKRLGTLALRDLREKGVVAEALISQMARIGSSQPVELRKNLQETADGFDLGHFGSAPTKFDADELFPLTARHLQTLEAEDVQSPLRAVGVPSDLEQPFWSVIRENITTLHDVALWWDICKNGTKPLIAPEDQDFVKLAFSLLPNENFTADTWGLLDSGSKI